MSYQRYVLGLCVWGCSLGGAFAHGLIESPPSRNWYCGAVTKPDHVPAGTAKHPECAAAFAVNQLAAYNYMSVVTHSLGRASVTPLPKNVCGFDGEYWQGAKTPWDAAMAWPTTPMTAGEQTFKWNINTGPHFDDTEEFRYWITKPTFVFSPAKELTWNDFETEAFCILKYDDKNPTASPNVSTLKSQGYFINKCKVPERIGHHVIYAEWGRTPPTIERFHGCIDVAFGTSSIRTRTAPGGKSLQLYGPQKKRTDVLGRVRKTGAGAVKPKP